MLQPNDSELRVAVAEALGWEFDTRKTTTWNHGTKINGLFVFGFKRPGQKEWVHEYLSPVNSNRGFPEYSQIHDWAQVFAFVPDYPNSRDACALFEATLTLTEQYLYGSELARLLFDTDDSLRALSTDRDDFPHMFNKVATATPRQRCLAYLTAKGKRPAQ